MSDCVGAGGRSRVCSGDANWHPLLSTVRRLSGFHRVPVVIVLAPCDGEARGEGGSRAGVGGPQGQRSGLAGRSVFPPSPLWRVAPAGRCMGRSAWRRHGHHTHWDKTVSGPACSGVVFFLLRAQPVLFCFLSTPHAFRGPRLCWVRPAFLPLNTESVRELSGWCLQRLVDLQNARTNIHPSKCDHMHKQHTSNTCTPTPAPLQRQKPRRDQEQQRQANPQAIAVRWA